MLLSTFFYPAELLSLAFIAIAIIITYGTVEGHGPFLNLYEKMNAVIASQVFLLGMLIICSLFYAWLCEFRQKKSLNSLINRLTGFRPGRCNVEEFEFYPSKRVLLWKREALSALGIASRLLATPQLFLGRVHAHDREEVEMLLLQHAKRFNLSGGGQRLTFRIMNDALTYQEASMAFLPATYRIGNVRLTGIVVIN